MRTKESFSSKVVNSFCNSSLSLRRVCTKNQYMRKCVCQLIPKFNTSSTIYICAKQQPTRPMETSKQQWGNKKPIWDNVHDQYYNQKKPSKTLNKSTNNTVNSIYLFSESLFPVREFFCSFEPVLAFSADFLFQDHIFVILINKNIRLIQQFKNV